MLTEERIRKLISMETRCVSMFKNWATLAPNERAKAVLESESEECRRHARMLNAVLNLLTGRDEEVHFEYPEEHGRRSAADPVKTMIRGIRHHLGAENQFEKEYTRLGEAAEDIRIRAIFKELANDESRHHALLNKLLSELEKQYRNAYPDLFPPKPSQDVKAQKNRECSLG